MTKFIELTKWYATRGPKIAIHGQKVVVNIDLACIMFECTGRVTEYEGGLLKVPNVLERPEETYTMIIFTAGGNEKPLQENVCESLELIRSLL